MVGIGSIVEKGCDLLGLPEVVGDLAALGVDIYGGDWVRIATEAPDLLEDIGSTHLVPTSLVSDTAALETLAARIAGLAVRA